VKYAHFAWRFLSVLVILVLLAWPFGEVRAAAPAQAGDPRTLAQAILQKMTPEEKVGQLFLVTFKGREVTENSPIYDLIVNKHVGGVVLLAANDNFIGPDGTANDVFRLTNVLQQRVWDGTQIPGPDASGSSVTPQYVPLFIGIAQEGDLVPYDQILNDLTALPDEMAIGATWQPNLATKVGAVMGQELSALGVNLFIGPSLDVLDVLHTEGGDDLGTRTFGGDPYWVGEMGKAYITGLHQGSAGRIAVIAKHFPGRGGSDRPPDEEVATVRKSLEQLKQIELAPFFSVTGNAPSPEATTDGLLVSHIRYQGFQGNVRATTRPVSFDAAALEQIMALPPFSSWRQNGGVVVSDDLGSWAVRQFFDPTGQVFDARQVASNAFLAGNDLLYVNNFIASGDPDAYTTIVRTLEFFAQKFRQDPAFAQRVNISVERLLQLKLRLYPALAPDTVKGPADGLAQVGKSDSVSFEVAQKAVTLISPSASELGDTLPRPPGVFDRIVIFTDVRRGKQCSTCPEQDSLAVDSLQKVILRLYGPRAGGQVQQTKIASYSFNDLTAWLNGSTIEPTATLESDLSLSDWVIFDSLNVQPALPESLALRRLLAEKPSLLRNKHVIAFAFNAPYYLDATDISKLTVYYGLYSKTPAFVELAARLLFQEAAPAGAPPVSIPGIGYDLITATSPDPRQVIPVYLDLPEKPVSVTTLVPGAKTPTPGATPTPVPTPVPKFKVGDTLPLRTGVILDQNHNQVPDGTPVRFLITISTINAGESGTVQQIDKTTIQGVAHATYQIQTAGLLEFRVVSEPALTSSLIRLNASAGEAAAITAIAPTILPSATETPTLVPTATATRTPVPLPPPAPVLSPDDWFIAVIISWIGALCILWVGRKLVSLRWGVRWGLMAGTGGLLAYSYLSSGLPGSQVWFEQAGKTGVLIVTLLGILVGWGGGWIWKRWMERKARSQPAKRTAP